MSEHDEDLQEPSAEENFAELLAQSLSRSAHLEPGDKVEARILQIGAEWVFLDVGQKGEGVLDVKELLDAEGRLTVSAGERIQAYYLGRDDSELRFTTRVGGGASGTAQLEQAWTAGIPVSGRLEQEIKGGYEVKLPGGVRAFCPFSQLGLPRDEGPQALGRTLSFRITQFGEKGRNIVVSHRAIVEEEQRRRREELKKTLKEGMTVTGTVTSIQRYGAFIDLGGLEGLLPASEVGLRGGDLSQVLHVGQTVEVTVKSCDWQKNRISLGLRSAAADPWSKVGTTYVRGSTRTGTVARLTPFGAFVTLEDGIDGLLHISKIGEGRRINHPREVLKEGQKLAVTIEEVDVERRRLTLALSSHGGGEADAAAYLNRPPTSMGTLGELLRAQLEKKRD